MAEAAIAASVQDFDLEKLVYWMDHREELESFLRAVREASLALLEAGRRVPGYKLVARRATRKWKKPEEVVKHLRNLGYEFEQYMDMNLKSPAQLEKVVDDIPEEFIIKKSSGTTVAPESDKRTDLNEQSYSALKRFQE